MNTISRNLNVLSEENSKTFGLISQICLLLWVKENDHITFLRKIDLYQGLIKEENYLAHE